MDEKVTEGDMTESGPCVATVGNAGDVILVPDSNNQDGLSSQSSCGKAMDEDTDQTASDSNMDVAKQGSASSRDVSFHIDASQIVPVAATEQSSELHDLGLTVFNQEDYEQGVVAQLNAAIALEESERMKTILQKRLASVEESIKCTEQEIGHVDKVLRMLIQQNGADTSSQMRQVKRQQQNKLNQMKKLKATKKAIIVKMTGRALEIPEDGEETDDAFLIEESLGLPDAVPETESERMIRLGEMTPFGTVIKTEGSRVNNEQQKECATSDFEKYLLDQSQLSVATKKAVKHPHGGTTAKHNSCKRTKKAADSDNQSVKLEGYCMEQEDVNDRELDVTSHSRVAIKDDDDVFDGHLPNFQCMSTEGDESPPHKQYKNGKKCRPRRKKKSGNANNLGRDDGDRKVFQARIRAFGAQEQQRKRDLLVDGLEDTSTDITELGGGFNMPATVWDKLYNFQKTGVSWLWELHQQQAGGIIGDEMGLGKTIQMISFLAGLATSGLRDSAITSRYKGLGPVLIVCPATVMHQWVKEFHTWWPPFCVAVLHSSGNFTSSPGHLVRSVVQCCGVIITSYSSLVLQQEILLQHDWHYVVLDEGHKIRNPDAQITLACKHFRTPHRIILSGSPIQNNLKELWSLFDFVFPGKLGTLPDFMQHFSVPIVQGGYANSSDVQIQTAYKCACVLRDTINPYLLRRMKVDVRSSIQLPGKNEQVLFCRITQHQREIYQQYIDSKECQMILSGKYLVFPGLTTLRKICNHPDLSTGGPRVFGCPGEEGSLDEDMEYGYWKRSGKMIVVESLLKIWKKQDHKVLLFTQSRQMLDILEKFVRKRGYKSLSMDGTTAISSRQHLINKFNSDPELFMFLLTTKVGGLGVNLTGADRVIIFDPDWNPSTDMQAKERAWRIGQHRHVTIFRLLMAGTIEEKIYHRQIFKQFLTNRVLKDPKQRRFFKSNDLYELFTLGDDDAKHGTETSAIFAGTGSDIRIKARSKRKLEEPMKPCRSTRKKRDGVDLRCDNEKLRKMKDLAKRLSEQMKKGASSSSVDATCDAVDVKAETPDILPTSRECQVVQNGGRESRHGRRLKSRKKTKRRRTKDAVFEGSTVPHLVGLGDCVKDGCSDGENTEKDENYVLQKLLKKTGLHSAMQHDKIMMSSNPDYVLVENEAENVARQASIALKQSRRRINARPGVPTWTGQHGSAGAPRLNRRFGQKKNSRLMAVASATSGLPEQVTPVVMLPKSNASTSHFDGSSVGTMASSDDVRSVSATAAMSSEVLLTKMRLRNKAGLEDITEEEGDTLTEPSPEYMDIITDIRNVVAFGGLTDGQATTQEILDQFQDRLPLGDSAKFRAMLRQICSLEKCDGVGVWRLKEEFRRYKTMVGLGKARVHVTHAMTLVHGH